jgi:uncharacterized protein (TIGR00369 family)
MTVSKQRTGPFWDAAHGRAPMPRAAATLGLEVIDANLENGTIELAFIASDDFTTPLGDILGGFLAAMLYDTVGPCLLAGLAPDEFIETLDLHTSFLQPVLPGRISAKGRLVHREGNLAFLEATLYNQFEDAIAIATATIRIVSVSERAARIRR